VGLTFDTAHIFSSGTPIETLLYNVSTQPMLIHLNGNSTKFGSKTDIHAPLISKFDQIWSKDLLR